MVYRYRMHPCRKHALVRMLVKCCVIKISINVESKGEGARGHTLLDRYSRHSYYNGPPWWKNKRNLTNRI